MERIRLEVAFRDERGQIVDMLEGAEINAVTYITIRKDSVRGNHYHKSTTQWNYVTAGKIMIRTRKAGEQSIDTVVGKGDFVVIESNERHAFMALEDSELLVFTRGPRGGKEYKSDTFHDDVPLIESGS